MQERNIIFNSLLFLSLLAISCGKSEQQKLIDAAPSISVNIKDGLGRELKLARSPKRVISIAPNLTEIVFAIGAGDRLIGRSQACDFPEQVASITEITTWPELDREQIIAQKADLILSTDEIFGKEQIKMLEDDGNQIYLQSYKNLSDVYQGIRDLGSLLGMKDRAEKIADSLAAIEKRVVAITDNQVHYKSMMLISDDPLVVAGGAGFLNEMIGKAGGKNAFAHLKEAYPRIGIEDLLKAKPEIIIIPSQNEQMFATLVSKFPGLSHLPAVINKQVYRVDPDLFYRPGPRIIEGLLDLTNVLHSGLTPDQFLEE